MDSVTPLHLHSRALWHVYHIRTMTLWHFLTSITRHLLYARFNADTQKCKTTTVSLVHVSWRLPNNNCTVAPLIRHDSLLQTQAFTHTYVHTYTHTHTQYQCQELLTQTRTWPPPPNRTISPHTCPPAGNVMPGWQSPILSVLPSHLCSRSGACNTNRKFTLFNAQNEMTETIIHTNRVSSSACTHLNAMDTIYPQSRL